jgi:photosystem II stability/assembly factor-like uncharacterized protein
MRARVATRKGLFTIERQSRGAWKISEPAFLGASVTMALFDPRSESTYACLRHGHFGPKLHVQRRGASDWEELAAPAFPEDIPADKAGEERPSVDTIWCLEPGGADMAGELWCGTIPGGLFRSLDGGASWSLVRTLWDHHLRKDWQGGGADAPGIHSLCVDPRDPRRVLIGVSCGGAWVTRDRGESWSIRAKGMRAAYMPPELAFEENSQDPHRIVQCPAAPDHFWTQHHNGVFKTTDGAESWQEVSISPSSFGFGVVVHPRDPNTAWFVPAIKDELRVPVDGKLVVTRTRDGGKSFEVLRSGLPQEHAYDLIFRHAFDGDRSGECLAFGSTTGSLFVSDDQGDHWTLLSAHLPPIYCVRFD